MTPNLNPLITLILEKLCPNMNINVTDIDVILIATFADFMNRVLQYFTTTFLQSEHLEKIITFFANTLSQVREFKSNKLVFKFLSDLSNLKESSEKLIIQNFVPLISYHALLSTASISRNLYNIVIYIYIYIY